MSRRLGRAACLWAILALALALSGCSADGTSNGDVTVRRADLPFTFRVPADFTAESVDRDNTRGDVVALRALDKVNVIAVRRVAAGTKSRRTLRVLGQRVTSRVVSVGHGWGLECQYTEARRDTVLDACDEALGSVAFH